MATYDAQCMGQQVSQSVVKHRKVKRTVPKGPFRTKSATEPEVVLFFTAAVCSTTVVSHYL